MPMGDRRQRRQGSTLHLPGRTGRGLFARCCLAVLHLRNSPNPRLENRHRESSLLDAASCI